MMAFAAFTDGYWISSTASSTRSVLELRGDEHQHLGAFRVILRHVEADHVRLRTRRPPRGSEAADASCPVRLPALGDLALQANWSATTTAPEERESDADADAE